MFGQDNAVQNPDAAQQQLREQALRQQQNQQGGMQMNLLQQQNNNLLGGVQGQNDELFMSQTGSMGTMSNSPQQQLLQQLHQAQLKFENQKLVVNKLRNQQAQLIDQANQLQRQQGQGGQQQLGVLTQLQQRVQQQQTMEYQELMRLHKDLRLLQTQAQNANFPCSGSSGNSGNGGSSSSGLNGNWQTDRDTPHRREMIQHM